MKTLKRALSLLLAVVMTLGMAAFVGADNITFTDVSGHWAWTGGQISYLVSKNVLNGYKQSNGTYTFQPDGQVTRAEFIKMLDETFGLKATAPIVYSDVNGSDWFYPYFQKAAAQGYILNYGTQADPNGKLTREEAISLLVRYLNLPADKQEISSYFSDYYTISEQYRNYIMQAAYANVVDGYTDTGVRMFQPKRVLTRAEALTILYRAAGAIFNGTTDTRDSGAPSTNNVFVTGGSTVIDGLFLSGRNIVSEGAESGALTFTNCTFTGPLTIRGKADVIFYRCKADEINIEGGGSVSFLDRSTAKTVNVTKCSTLNINSGTTVDVLNVLPGAASLSISGDGAITAARVQARGLVSSIMPGTYEVSAGLTAVFAGTEVSGKTGDIEAFDEMPFVFTDGSNSYVAVKPSVSGTIYGYYSNSEEIPPTNNFDSYYESANYTVRFNAAGQVWTAHSGQSQSSVGDFRYLILQLQQETRRYTPVLVRIENLTTDGMYSEPTLTSTNLTVRAGQAGSVYWFYTDSGAEMNQAEFLTRFDSTAGALRGKGNVSPTSPFYIALKEEYISKNGYVAIMLQTSTGGYFVPLIFSVGETGFLEGPAVKTAGVITYKTAKSGTFCYYLTNEKTPPLADKYQAEFNAARYSGSFAVSINESGELKFDTERTKFYPYMVIALRTSANTYLQPIVLQVDIDTGFDTNPAVQDEKNGIIRFITKERGSVQYYYTSVSTAPDVEEFNRTYKTTDSRYTGSIRVTPNSYETIQYNLQYVSSRPYMAIMFTDGQGNEYSPVLVTLKNSTGSGFRVEPRLIDGKITFTTEKDGQVMMFYTTNGSPIAADDFYGYYTDSIYRDSVSTVAGVSASITVDPNARRTNRYAVLAFLPKDAEVNGYGYSYPIILDLAEAESENLGTGLTATVLEDSKKVILIPDYDGTVYYYYTDYEYELPTASSFETMYRNAAGATNKTVSKGYPTTFDGITTRYAVFSLRYNNHYLTPVIVDMKTGSEYSNGVEDHSNVTGTGFNYVKLSTDMKTVTFSTKVSGTVSILQYDNGRLTVTGMQAAATADVEGTITIPNYAAWLEDILSGNGLYIRLVSSTGDIYEAQKLLTVGN